MLKYGKKKISDKKEENILNKVKEKVATLPKKKLASETANTKAAETKIYDQTTENEGLQAIQKRLNTNSKIRDEDDTFGEVVFFFFTIHFYKSFSYMKVLNI